MKKLNAVLGLILTAAIMLAGCGTGAANSASTGASTEATAEENVNQGEKTEIVFWSHQRHDKEYVEQKVNEFNETNDKNIKVVYEVMSENYDNNLDLSFQSKQAPDVFRAKGEIMAYVKKGMAQPITEYLTQEDYDRFGELLGINNINKYKGEIYTVPGFGNTYRLVYNKDIFKKAGLDPEKYPTTMEEVREYAKIITEKLSGEGIYGFAMNLKQPLSAMERSVDEVARKSGAYFYDFKEGKYDFSAYGEVVKSFANIYNDGSFFPGVESLDIDPLRTQFSLGNIGMYISGYWEVGVYNTQFPTDQEWAACAIPTLNGEVKSKNNIIGAGKSFLVSSQTEKQEAVWEFIKFMTSDEFMVGYQEGGFGIIGVSGIAEKASECKTYGSEYFSISDSDTIATLSPERCGMVVEGKTFYDAFGAAIMGDGNIDEIVKQMDESYNSALKKALEQGDIEPIITE